MNPYNRSEEWQRSYDDERADQLEDDELFRQIEASNEEDVQE